MKTESPLCYSISQDFYFKESRGILFENIAFYLPWRDENYLKHDNGTYATKYEEVESDILDNIKNMNHT